MDTFSTLFIPTTRTRTKNELLNSSNDFLIIASKQMPFTRSNAKIKWNIYPAQVLVGVGYTVLKSIHQSITLNSSTSTLRIMIRAILEYFSTNVHHNKTTCRVKVLVCKLQREGPFWSQNSYNIKEKLILNVFGVFIKFEYP